MVAFLTTLLSATIARFREGEAPAEPHDNSANGSAGASPSRRPTPRITQVHLGKEALVRPERFSFAAHRGTFRIGILLCSRLECPCTEVTFDLLELPEAGEQLERPARFQIRVDVAMWQEVKPPPRSPQEAAIVAEFLRDYPPSERDELRRYFDERQSLNRRLNDCRIPAERIEDRTLVEFRELMQRTGDASWDSRLGEYLFECNGVEYMALEGYCPNPECPCREVVLSFLRCEPPAGGDRPRRAEEQFAAKLELDGGVALQKVFFGSRSEAEAVLAAWQEEFGDDLDGLGWRYEKIKEIARRSWPPGRRQPAPPAPREPLAPASRRVGRNDPCPCGSGKKYKKCCGPAAKQDLSSDAPT